MDTTPSEEQLIDELRSFAEEVAGVPTVRAMRNEGPYSPYYYKQQFGSWHDALRAADIQPTHGVTPDIDRETLITELERIDEITDRPPRRTDVEEHGSYPYTLYDEEFESFIHALEAAGIDPDEKQYRFSSVDVPEEKKGSANLELLRKNGPTPATELPQDRSTKDRQRGMWKFTVSSGSTQPANAIYYLHGDHAPELVLRRFFQHNPHVLEYRDAHGIKMDIKNHQPSWKEIGREIVDELLSEGVAPPATFENLVVIRAHEEETLGYCFERSISTIIDTEGLPLSEEVQTGPCPIWGFSRNHEELWRTLSERDGLIFSTQPGLFTHYVPISRTIENTEIMTELWVEYENGVRTGGIDQPWPYLVLGEGVQEIRIQEQELSEEIEPSLAETPIQLLDEESLDPFLNTYGNFESYIRNHDAPNSPPDDGTEEPSSSSTSQEVLNTLLEITPKDIRTAEDNIAIGEIERETRSAAFEAGIHEIYQGCAICGNLFESPDGSSDLVATHILPPAHDGPDLLQNGLGLCSHHHWAFTNGWFEIGADYEIRVRDYPELYGYDELQQYDGEYLYVPTNGSLHPHPHYLQQRNQLHDTTATSNET